MQTSLIFEPKDSPDLDEADSVGAPYSIYNARRGYLIPYGEKSYYRLVFPPVFLRGKLFIARGETVEYSARTERAVIRKRLKGENFNPVDIVRKALDL